MSDSGLELAYEQDEQAKQRRLRLYVDGVPVLTVVDTPEGRRRIDGEAFKAVQTHDDVKVVPLGAEATGVAPRQREQERRSLALASTSNRADLDDSIADHPAGGRASNVCAYCVPVVSVQPSGRRLRHDLTCPDQPGERISAREYAQGREWGEGRRS